MLSLLSILVNSIVNKGDDHERVLSGREFLAPTSNACHDTPKSLK